LLLVGSWHHNCQQMAQARLKVPPFNAGTQTLYSAWRPIKLPSKAIAISAKALRQWRVRAGLSQRQVAWKMGWNSVNTYGQLELGKRRGCMPATLAKLARALGCKVSELIS
jgi:DNA-binding XRE family transcriptional regulator